MAKEFYGGTERIEATITALTGSFTFGGWFYSKTDSSNSRYFEIQAAGAENGRVNQGTTATQSIICNLPHVGTTASFSGASGNFALNAWYCMFVVYTSSDQTPRGYVGDLDSAVAQISYGAGPVAGTSGLNMGSGTSFCLMNRPAGDRGNNGRVGPVFLDHRAWTVEEMERFRLGVYPISDGNMRFFWPLDSPTLAQAEDLSGNGVHGTVTSGAPQFVNAGSIVTDVTGGASTAVTMGAHLPNDILLAQSFNQAGSAMATSTSGWAEITEVDGTTNHAWYWKRAAAAGEAGPTITAASTDQFAVGYVVRGAIASGTPYEDATTSGDGTATDSTPDTASIDTTDTNRLAVAMLNHDDDTAFSSGYPPATWTDNSRLTSATGTQAGFAFMSKSVAAAGNVAAVAYGTLAAAELYGSLTLAFIPSVATVVEGPPVPTGYGEMPNPALFIPAVNVTIQPTSAIALGTVTVPTPQILIPAPVAGSVAVATAPVPMITVIAGAAAVGTTVVPTLVLTSSPTIIAPAAAAVGTTVAPVPQITIVAPVATAVAVSAIATASITIHAGPAEAVATATAPTPQITITAGAAAIATVVAPTITGSGTSVTIIAPAATAVAVSAIATASITILPAPAEGFAAATAPTPQITITAPVATAVGVATAPTPAITIVSTPAGAIATVIAPVLDLIGSLLEEKELGTVAISTVTMGTVSVTAKAIGSVSLTVKDHAQCIPGGPYCHPLQAIPSAGVSDVTLTAKTVGSF